MPTVGKRLRRARLAKQLTQQELADRIGAKRNAIVAWENDRRVPRNLFVQKLANILDVPRSTFNRYGGGGTTLAPKAEPHIIYQITLNDLFAYYEEGMSEIGQPVTVEVTPVNPLMENELRHIVEDHSMDDGTRAGLKPGDVVALSKTIKPRDGDLVLAYVREDQLPILREYRDRGPGFFDLIAANPEFSTVTCNSQTPIDIFATVIRTLSIRH
jgi:transcriptional regulator with XRE-family HTH domain